jgi:glycerophosphoryl diester phosphodiesterase
VAAAGLVADLTADEIGRLDAGSWFSPAYAGERVPLLDDVLTWARRRAGLVISFDHFAVRRVEQLDSRVQTAIIYGGRPLDAVAMARAAHPRPAALSEVVGANLIARASVLRR